MTRVYDCVWECEWCPTRVLQTNDMMEISQGMVKCPECGKKMMLVDIHLNLDSY